MSQLDSILAELKKSLSEKGVDLSAHSPASVEGAVDAKSATIALKEFLSKNPVTVRAEGAVEDPIIIIERRKTISNFIGAQLTNNGVASLPGTISGEQGKIPSHGHGSKGAAGSNGTHAGASQSHNSNSSEKSAQAAVPFSPPPMPVLQICPSCVETEASKKAERKKEEKGENEGKQSQGQAKSPELVTPALASAVVPAMQNQSKIQAAGPEKAISDLSYSPKNSLPGASFSQAPISNAAAQETNNRANETPNLASPAATPAETRNIEKADAVQELKASSKPSSKSGGVVGFFAGLMPKAKQSNQDLVSSSGSTFAQAPSYITWFKHIQTIESALLMGDIHFADSILQLLYESARSLSAEANIIARLQSLQAKVMIERRQFDEAEKGLKEMIRSLESTPFATNVAHAYCWRALASCYHRQKKTTEAESAHKRAVEIAEAALGAKDPEAMLFREPVS